MGLSWLELAGGLDRGEAPKEPRTRAGIACTDRPRPADSITGRGTSSARLGLPGRNLVGRVSMDRVYLYSAFRLPYVTLSVGRSLKDQLGRSRFVAGISDYLLLLSHLDADAPTSKAIGSVSAFFRRRPSDARLPSVRSSVIQSCERASLAPMMTEWEEKRKRGSSWVTVQLSRFFGIGLE